jgi:hypothetical protein
MSTYLEKYERLPRSRFTHFVYGRLSSYFSVYDTEIYDRNTGSCKSSYFSVYGRLRPCVFDLGGQSIDYLDIRISVEIPSFRTKVYRKLAAQPYILPFHSSHPLHIFKNIPFSAMLRATRICSHAEDLKEEIQRIRIILLLNKYPPNFIGKYIIVFIKLSQEKMGQNYYLVTSTKHSVKNL